MRADIAASDATMVPLDVRVMNWVSVGMLAAAVAGLLAWAGHWALSHGRFALQKIVVLGDTQHNSAATLRANVLPKLRGNFLVMDLRAAKTAFEQVPWVRQAVVQRDFPNKLRVHLQEHVAVAMFGPEGAEQGMVNQFGEVFRANEGDLTETLPRLVGEPTQAARLWSIWQSLNPIFEPLDMSIEELQLQGRGSWRLLLDNGAVVELGQSEDAELAPKLQRFVRSVTSAAHALGRQAQHLELADLRHSNGYAIKLQGVTTQSIVPKNKV